MQGMMQLYPRNVIFFETILHKAYMEDVCFESSFFSKYMLKLVFLLYFQALPVLYFFPLI